MNGSFKDLRQLVKQAEKQGWEVTRTGGDHLKWVSPLGAFFFSASTPSDIRGLKNLKRDLRVYGFIELKRQKGKK